MTGVPFNVNVASTDVYYLAGPMTGYPQFNFPAFIDAAKEMRRKGLCVISPVELDQEEEVYRAAMASLDGALDDEGKVCGRTWGDLLARDVKVIADQCTRIMLLPDWERSKGARLETFVAIQCGYPVFTYASLNKRYFPWDPDFILETIKANTLFWRGTY